MRVLTIGNVRPGSSTLFDPGNMRWYGSARPRIVGPNSTLAVGPNSGAGVFKAAMRKTRLFGLMGLGGLGADPTDPTDPLTAGSTAQSDVVSPNTVMMISLGVSALGAAVSGVHGYKRNRGKLGWTALWTVMGGIFPVPSAMLAIGQGYGKRK